jgi:hypothetical protein
LSDSKERPGQVWSQAPPGASRGKKQVVIAGAPALNHTGVARRKHLGAVFGSRDFVWAIALIGGGGFLAAAAISKNAAVSAAIPAAVLIVAAALAWRKAGQLAVRDFFYGYAVNHGLTYSSKLSLLETTPLLGAGDKRHCEHYMEGPIGGLDGIHAGMAYYIYETVEQRRGRRSNQTISVHTPHYYTICVVELQRALTTFPGVFLRQRTGFFGGDDWLDVDGLRDVELESSSLSSKYKLQTRSNQNMTRLLELFQPSFQVWLSELPFEIYFEFSGGTLVTYVPRHVTDTTSLDIIFETTARIAKRILKTGEPLHPVSVAAGGPSAPDFSPPPPQVKPHIEAVPSTAPPPSGMPPGTPPGMPPGPPPFPRP